MTGMRNIEEEEEEDLPTPGETGAVFEKRNLVKFQIIKYLNIKLFQTCTLDPREPISEDALQQVAVMIPNVSLISPSKVAG